MFHYRKFAITTTFFGLIGLMVMLFTIEAALADTDGALKGKVYDSTTQKPVCRPCVKLGDASSASDSDGTYLTFPVSSGTHTLKVTAPGYQCYQADVSITGGKIMTCNVPLKPLGQPRVMNLRNIASIAIDKADCRYIAGIDRCPEHFHIHKFDAKGNFITDWGVSRYRPHLAMDSKGCVYAIDQQACRILKYDSNGDLLNQWD